MCGFAGELRLYENNFSNERLKRALANSSYRGPDATSIYEKNNILIGFNRLSINNLATGDQPRCFKSKYNTEEDSILTFNGEIFNYKELESLYLTTPFNRDEAGVLVDLYKKMGTDMFSLLNGQFAIAIYDATTMSVILCRDPFGIRPLFYLQRSSSIFFGSDIESLIIHAKATKQIDIDQLARLHLTWSYGASSTIWQGIQQISAGCFKEFRLNNKTSEIKTNLEFPYWDWCKLIADQEPNVRKITSDDIARFKYELESAVKRQTMSDVGYTSYVSGGIDSAVIAHILVKSCEKLPTYSVDFIDNDYSEGFKQKLVHSKLKTNHNTLLVNDQQIGSNFGAVSQVIGQPFFRTAPIPLYMLARKVRQDGHKVVLTGEGADEILFGYDIFRERKAIDFLKAKPNSNLRRHIFDNLYSYLPQFRNKRYRKLAIETLLREGDYGALTPLSSRLANNSRSLNCYKNSSGISANVVQKLKEEYDNIPEDFTNQQIIQYFEIQNLLSGYLLSAQGDRVSMGNSVEGRYPYLDLEFVKYSFKIPMNHKLMGMSQKQILKVAYKDDVPQEIINAPKIAYQAPEARAILSNPLNCDKLMNTDNPIFQFVDRKKLDAIVTRCKDTNSRGSFSDNMNVCILSSLSFLA